MLRHIRSVGLVLLGLLASTAPAMSPSADFDVTQVASGVYAQVPGPQFETPAEIHMLRALGADKFPAAPLRQIWGRP